MIKNRTSDMRIAFIVTLIITLLTHAYAQEEEQPADIPSIEIQVLKLQSRFFSDRSNAAKMLIASGKNAVDIVDKAASSGNPEEFALALHILCKLAPEKAAPRLLEAARHESISVRIAAARATENLGIKGAKAMLESVSKLPEDKRPNLRMLLAHACQKEVTDILAAIWNNTGRQGMFHGQYRDLTKHGPAIEPALSKIVSNPSEFLAEAAASALAELGDKAAIPALKQAYNSNRVGLKERAAAAMHLLGEDGPYKELEDVFKKACEEGGTTAYSALANFYSRTRDYAKGEKTMKEMLARFGASGTAYLNLACFLSMQKKIDEALEAFVKAVEGGYTNMEWVKVDGELANLRASRKFLEYAEKKFPGVFKKQEKEKPDGENK